MRFPFTKIYRAFPELDNYRDDQCERFVAAARGRWVRRLFRFLLAMVVAFVSQVALWVFIVFALSAEWFANLKAQYGTSLAVTGAFLLIPVCLIGFLPALLLRDRMLLGQIRSILIERGFCIKCHYSLIGLPVTERKFMECPDCEKPVVLKDSRTPVCPTCNEKLDGEPRSEWVVICAECGNPGMVDSSLSELTINPETSTLKAADN